MGYNGTIADKRITKDMGGWMKLGEICLQTNDVLKMAEFYKMLLKVDNKSRDEIHQAIIAEETMLTIYNDGIKKDNHNHNISIAFSVDDVDKEYERLLALGVEIIEGPKTRPWGARNMSFYDPDRNTIYLRSRPGSEGDASGTTGIRKMSIHDYDKVYKLWTSTPGMGMNHLDDSRGGIEKYLMRNPNTCFVSEHKDGTLDGVIMSGHDGRRGYIYHLAVSMESRGQGIGKGLLEHAVEALRQEGIKKAALVAFSDNEIGNQFWELQGFTVRNDLTYRNRVLNDE
mgnify:CR=1 FL=1